MGDIQAQTLAGFGDKKGSGQAQTLARSARRFCEASRESARVCRRAVFCAGFARAKACGEAAGARACVKRKFARRAAVGWGRCAFWRTFIEGERCAVCSSVGGFSSGREVWGFGKDLSVLLINGGDIQAQTLVGFGDKKGSGQAANPRPLRSPLLRSVSGERSVLPARRVLRGLCPRKSLRRSRRGASLRETQVRAARRGWVGQVCVLRSVHRGGAVRRVQKCGRS